MPYFRGVLREVTFQDWVVKADSLEAAEQAMVVLAEGEARAPLHDPHTSHFRKASEAVNECTIVTVEPWDDVPVEILPTQWRLPGLLPEATRERLELRVSVLRIGESPSPKTAKWQVELHYAAPSGPLVDHYLYFWTRTGAEGLFEDLRRILHAYTFQAQPLEGEGECLEVHERGGLWLVQLIVRKLRD